MIKKIAVLGFVSGFAIFLYGRKLLQKSGGTSVVDVDAR